MQEDQEDFGSLFQTIKTDGGSDEDSDDEDPDDDSVLLEEFGSLFQTILYYHCPSRTFLRSSSLDKTQYLRYL